MSKAVSANSGSIDVIGADANNLKNVDVVFPLKRISVVTGVSGSGKSSSVERYHRGRRNPANADILREVTARS